MQLPYNARADSSYNQQLWVIGGWMVVPPPSPPLSQLRGSLNPQPRKIRGMEVGNMSEYLVSILVKINFT